ncbi:hypothetical protein [Microbacterium elymi]|uniref:alpha/beta hydrolase family protein n=1 Tax=Microbacterium elymi TaxID=2909587 RepID=UPI003F494B7A
MRTTPFDSLDDYIALPRTDSLALSPDGRRAVVAIATLNKDGTGYDRALWEIDATGTGTGACAPPADPLGQGRVGPGLHGGRRPAVPVGAPGRLGLRRRPGPAVAVPAGGGEARPVTRLAGGVSAIEAVAAASDVVIVRAPLLPLADTVEDDARLRAERTKHKVAAILHEGYPVRYWDHDLGPDEPHLFALSLDELADPVGVDRAEDEDDEKDAASRPYPASLPRPRELTPHPGRSADAFGVTITPDGTTVVAALQAPEGRDERARLIAIEVATGDHTVVRDEHEVDNESPTISHDGTTLAWVRTVKSTAAAPTDQEVWVSGIDGSGARRIAGGWDRWPSSLAFAADDAALVVTADQDGRGPVFRVPLDDTPVAQADRRRLHVSEPVRRPRQRRHRGPADELDAAAPRGAPVDRRGDGASVTRAAAEVPATMTEVETTAADGARVRGWLRCRPPTTAGQRPRPRLLWIHGGPLNSWNAWSWRWNPQLAVARGYAVLPAGPGPVDRLRPGLHRARVEQLGRKAVHRSDGDHRRGGRARRHRRDPHGGDGRLVRRVHGELGRRSHRSVPRDRHPREPVGARPVRRHHRPLRLLAAHLHPEAMIAHSPHRFVRDIRTPLLVIHGDRDYRVPIGEGCGCGPSSMSISPPRTARCRTSSCTSRTRTTGCCGPSTRWSGTRPCSRSSTSTCGERTGSDRTGSADRERRAPSSTGGPRRRPRRPGAAPCRATTRTP